MRTNVINIAVILITALILILLNQMSLQFSSKYMLVPLIAFYYLGRFVQKQYGTSKID